MASLQPAVLAAACVLLLALSASTSPVPPAVHSAGDGISREWTVPSAPPPGNGSGTPNQWAMRRLLHVGDVLDFKLWNGTAAVLLVRRGDYDRCATASPVSRFADGGGCGNTTRFTLDRQGLFYFIAGAPGRCEAGQRVAVHVAAARGASPNSAPAPAPDVIRRPPADESVPSDRPWKMVAYAALGFAAGSIFSWLCIFFLVRCGNRE